MKKNIWILNHYAGGMYFDKGGRHYNFAKYLKAAGCEPLIFCANSQHGPGGTWFSEEGLWREHMAEEIGVPFVFVKARSYTGNGRQRVLNMLDFYRNVKKAAKEYAAKYGKPDIIYASSVHPLTLVAGLHLAKHFGVKCVCEVRDLWPETIVAYGIAGPHNPAVFALRRLEKWIYKKADAVVFTMEGAYDYIKKQKWEEDVPRSKVFYINNGVDLEQFHYNREHFRIEDPDLEDPEAIKVVYTGSIRKVNHLGVLLDVAKQVQDSRIRFLIWGDGDELDELRRRAEQEHIENVVFKGRVEKKYVPSIISRSDLNLVHNEMSPILRFGASYNKLFEYFAAGRPIFSTIRPGHSLVEKYRCGADTEEITPESFAKGVQTLAALPSAERDRMGRNARKAAGDYDFRNLTRKLIEVIES